MNSYKQWLSTGLTMMSLLAIGAPAFASNDFDNYRSQVNTCVAEVQARADFSNAVRVRYDVNVAKRRVASYLLKIDAYLYQSGDSEAIRAYSARCVVNARNETVKFEIRESGSEA